MAGEVTGPNLGLTNGWDPGDDTWKPGMDVNLQELDGLVHLAVLDLAQNTPPSSVNGDRFTVGAAPAGDFSTFSQHDVAVRAEGAWKAYTPKEGWRLWDNNSADFLFFDGAAWVVEPAGHTHANKVQLDLVSDGDHDVVVTGNPHAVTQAQAAAAGGHTVESFSGGGTHNPAAATDVVMVDTAAGIATLNIPSPVGRSGRPYYVKKTDTGTNVLTVTPAAGNIEGGASLALGGAGRDQATLVSDNVNWWVLGA